MRFEIPRHLLDALRELRKRRALDPAFAYEIERSGAGFLLVAGLGPALFLTEDGSVLVDRDELWGESEVRPATDAEATAAIVSGARRLGLPDLLLLLPSPPSGAPPCRTCNGGRWLSIGVSPAAAEDEAIVCPTCAGVGWVDAGGPADAPFAVFFNGIPIGHSSFEQRDGAMAIANGTFFPTLNYYRLKGQLGDFSGLSVRSTDGSALPLSRVWIADHESEAGPGALEVAAQGAFFGVGGEGQDD